ncbi:MAG: spore germination protein [Clostridiales bacterium]|jgi:stage V sporulation protein AF|nr:spore germination protein [Clostridiales bacterium]
MSFFNNFCETITQIETTLRVKESFDLINRTIKIAGRQACIFFIDGLVKDEVMEKIMEFFYSVKEGELTDADTFSKEGIPYVEVDITSDLEQICANILSGILVLVVEGFDKALAIDVRTYPQRSVDEPEKDKVLRGSRDGFVETLVMNTALIRRRIRDADFTVKIFNVGSRSKTDVVMCYMDSMVDHKLLDRLSKKLETIKVEALTMNQQSLVEAIYPYPWYNPFPKFKYSERPDSTASSILEGNIVILVDNSPSAIIVPTSIFDIVEEADDYYFPPITGTYLRLSRYLVTIATLLVTPLWLLALQNPQYVPSLFQFVLLKDPVNIPIFWQLMVLELAIDGLRLASLNTPSALSTSLSVIAGIILSDFAVTAGWFTTEALLYMAFVAIANYSQPSYELGYALKFMRILILILTALFNIWGFVIGCLVTILLISFNKTLSGKSYLYPLIPFHGKEFLRRFFRVRIQKSR